MHTIRTSEKVEEYLYYCINGETYFSYTTRKGSRRYTIDEKNRFILAKNEKDFQICCDEQIKEKLKITKSLYGVLLNLLRTVGDIRQFMISAIFQKKTIDFSGNIVNRRTSDEDYLVELKIRYYYKGREVPVYRSKKTSEKEIVTTLWSWAIDIKKYYSFLFKLPIVNIKASKYEMILCAGQGGILFHEGIGHNLEADLYYKQENLLYGKLGKKYFNNNISVSDICDKDCYINYEISADGAKPRNVELIKNGYINQLMTDTYYSKVYQVPNTGNGRAATFENIPIPRMRNTFLHNGNIPLKMMIHDVREGVIALEMEGGSVDYTNGDFMLHITIGGYIKNGEIVALIPPCAMKGDVISSLNSISAIGNDLSFKYAKCIKDGQEVNVSYGSPSIKIEKQSLYV